MTDAAASAIWAAAEAAAGVPLAAGARGGVLRLLDLVDAENRVQNLTAIRDRATAMVDHVVDSLALAGVAAAAGRPIRAGSRCVDIGSGAGFPGLPLALAFPGSRWILAESEGRKAAFLRRAVAALGLADVGVFEGRGREVRRRVEGAERAADLVTARAVANLGTLAREARGLAAPGGLLIFPKGDALDPAERALGDREAAKGRFEPLGVFPMAVPGRRRVAVVYRSSGS